MCCKTGFKLPKVNLIVGRVSTRHGELKFNPLKASLVVDRVLTRHGKLKFNLRMQEA